MIIRGNAIEAELYFDDDGAFVVNILTPMEVVLPNGNVAYVNKCDEPFIIGESSEVIEEELDELLEFIRGNSEVHPELS